MQSVILFIILSTVSCMQPISNDLHQNQPISNDLNKKQPISNDLNQKRPISNNLKKQLEKLEKRGDEYLLGNLSSKKNRRRLRNLLPKRLYRNLMFYYRQIKRQDRNAIRNHGHPYTQKNKLDGDAIAFVRSPVLCSPAGTMKFYTSICYGNECVFFEFEQEILDCLTI